MQGSRIWEPVSAQNTRHRSWVGSKKQNASKSWWFGLYTFTTSQMNLLITMYERISDFLAVGRSVRGLYEHYLLSYNIVVTASVFSNENGPSTLTKMWSQPRKLVITVELITMLSGYAPPAASMHVCSFSLYRV